jgi:hypothetical protein
MRDHFAAGTNLVVLGRFAFRIRKSLLGEDGVGGITSPLMLTIGAMADHHQGRVIGVDRELDVAAEAGSFEYHCEIGLMFYKRMMLCGGTFLRFINLYSHAVRHNISATSHRHAVSSRTVSALEASHNNDLDFFAHTPIVSDVQDKREYRRFIVYN